MRALHGQHRGGGRGEGFLRRPGERVQRCAQGDGLDQERRDPVEGAFARELLRVLGEELRRVQRDAELAGGGFDERDLPVLPAARRVPVGGEDSDHLLVGDERHRECGARAELQQRLPAAERGIVELRCGCDVGDRDRPPFADGEVRDGQARRPAADRLLLRPAPLAGEDQLPLGTAETDEAAVGLEHLPDRLDPFAHDLVDVAVRPHTGREPRDRRAVAGGRRRPQPLDHRCRLRAERKQPGDLVVGERPLATERGEDEHRLHALLGDQRHEREAAGADALDEALAHQRRRGRVVDRERGGVVVRARHARRLVLEVEPDARKPLELAAALRRENPASDRPLLLDDHERPELDLNERGRLVDQRPGGVLERAGLVQPAAIVLRARPVRLRVPAIPREEGERRQGGDEDRGEAEPAVTSQRLAVAEDQEREDHAAAPPQAKPRASVRSGSRRSRRRPGTSETAAAR